jgi:hypothetical protein
MAEYCQAYYYQIIHLKTMTTIQLSEDRIATISICPPESILIEHCSLETKIIFKIFLDGL